MNFIRNLAAWIVRALLSLRYDITLIDKEKLLQREGVSILPNHPGEIDPVIVFSHLWNPMQPRGMAVEDFYYMPVPHYLMQMIRVIPMPNMYGGIGSYYVTGDLGILDESNSLVITGRMKRFVKIGGEMISLPAMETVNRNNMPQNEG